MKDELTNLRFENGRMELSRSIEVLWRNDSRSPIKDFNLLKTKSTFLGYDDSFVVELEESWKELSNRARILSPNLEHFLFEDKKVLRWEGFSDNNSADPVINLSSGISYKLVTGVRSRESLFSKLNKLKSPRAFAVANILITADRKIVLGKRKFYGDWPLDTYECPGGFFIEDDFKKGSLKSVAKRKIEEDYLIGNSDLRSIPFVIYSLPRILEVIALFISKVGINSNELKSNFYKDIISFDCSENGLNELKTMPLEIFHPPSRIIMEFLINSYSDFVELSARV